MTGAAERRIDIYHTQTFRSPLNMSSGVTPFLLMTRASLISGLRAACVSSH